MFMKDMCGNTRFYVRGTKEKLEKFTINFTWYESAMGHISSINEMNDGSWVLNIIVTPENYGDDEWLENTLRDLAHEHGCTGFTSWNEFK